MSNPPIQIAVAIAPKITGLISLGASAFLAYYVLSSKERRSKVSNRIILGLSISDVFFSFVVAFLSTWPVPSDTPSNLVFGAAGNALTCRAQGFLDQWSGRSSYVYNATLSVYYLLVVKFNFTDTQLKRHEWAFHLPPLLVGLGTAVSILTWNMIHFTGGWTCWISDYPLNCSQTEGVTCEAGQMAFFYRLVFNSIPLWICEVIMTVSMVLIFHSVYKAEKATRSYTNAGNTGGAYFGTLTKQTAYQGLLYTLAFYVTWFFTTFRIIEGLVHNSNPSGNVTFFLEALLLPMQGFWNTIIYIRPRYIQMKQSHPNRTFGQIMGDLARSGRATTQHT